MPQEWEQGNAARELSYDESSNPYKPLDYAARLKNAGKRPVSGSSSLNYAPGQLYGGYASAQPEPPAQEVYTSPAYGAPYAPPVYSAPPAAAPQAELPSYLQTPGEPSRRTQREETAPAPASSLPVREAQPGALYSADIFSHQPTAVMPSGFDDTPFASRTADDFVPFFEEPPLPPPEPVQAEPSEFTFEDVLEPRPWRDPFTPAAPKEDEAPAPKKSRANKSAPKAKRKPQRPPVRMGRVAALILAAGMLLFCCIAGGRIVLELVRNENDVEAALNEYRERTGTELKHSAARVDLLPEGQTFIPTATPSPTRVVNTPTPTPIIPINEAAILSMNKRKEEQPQEIIASESTPNPRTRQTTYVKNPLRNVHTSLTELIKQNSDVVGRLVIDGVLDEVVMQRNNTYYLTHNSLNLSNEAGAVFLDEGCDLRNPPENILLRGQCIVPGKTFHPLLQYAAAGGNFVSTAATARLTTLYEEERYVLFAVIVAGSNPASSHYFNYASHPSFATDAAMMSYVESAKQHSLYSFNVDVQPADRLMTLATMGGTDTLVLLYRMVREGEGY